MRTINDLYEKWNSINDIPVECQIWDIDRIYRVCFSDLGRQDIEIDFKAYTQYTYYIDG